MTERHVDYPLRIDTQGRIAGTTGDDHIRDMIYQVLFTNPGERVNRPDFGCGLLQMVFLPSSDALATATQFMVQGALQRWLSDVIDVRQVDIKPEGERLLVSIVYVQRETGDQERILLEAPSWEGA